MHVPSTQVANEAIKQAERNGQHVVLVDTAGRMQVRCCAAAASVPQLLL